MLPTMTELAAAMVARQEMPPEKGELGPIGPNGKAGLDGENGRNGDPGRQGDRGERGQDGVTGADGRNGADGKDGVNGEPGLVWRGPWVRNLAYYPDDAVEQDGSSYVCTVATRSKPPSGAWDLLAKRGATGPPGMSRGGGGGGGGSALTVKDEGTVLDTAAASIDFVGAGVTATAVGHAVTVVVTAGSVSASEVIVDPEVSERADVQSVLERLDERLSNPLPVSADQVSVLSGVSSLLGADVQAVLDAVLSAVGWQWSVEQNAWVSIAVGDDVTTVGITIDHDEPVDPIGPFLVSTGIGWTASPGTELNLAGGSGVAIDTAGALLRLRGGRGRGSAAGGDITLETTRAGVSNVITGEELVAGDTPANTEITGSIANVPVSPSGVVTVTDSSPISQVVFMQYAGPIVGDIGSGGTNTWDPTTGDFSFSFAGASTGPVTADYDDYRTNALVETVRIRASDGFLLLHGSPFERAAFVDPVTATPEAIALSLIAAGLMAAA